jgi:predicted transcriptional regulator
MSAGMDDQFHPSDDDGTQAEDAAADAAALAEIAAGEGVPNDRVLRWLQQLARGLKVPRPQAS